MTDTRTQNPGTSSLSLYWFHSTSRTSVDGYFGVLRDGCAPPPDHNATKQCELKLGIPTQCVYCYLGRALESFGDFAVALRPDLLPLAQMSPFDTGGLVRRIAPVSTWKRKEKQRYLNAYTWSTTFFRKVILEYPGDSRTAVHQYLDGTRPSTAGPHLHWANRPIADIWSEPTNTVHAWLWEGRWGLKLPIVDALVAWACSPSQYAAILDYVDTLTAPDVRAEALRLLGMYVPGGVTNLLQHLREEQVGS